MKFFLRVVANTEIYRPEEEKKKRLEVIYEKWISRFDRLNLTDYLIQSRVNANGHGKDYRNDL